MKASKDLFFIIERCVTIDAALNSFFNSTDVAMKKSKIVSVSSSQFCLTSLC